MGDAPQTYLVGGAVRDRLLGRRVTDNDYVVVGSTPAKMLADGFTQIGAKFPVFLHPETRDEYALARTESSTGPGHTDFEARFEPTVTLEEDLRRRDLTINSMAQDGEGRIIDPFGGRRDLENGIIRHVSDAFAEDPLRVLRAARFAARLNFTVTPETLDLMRDVAPNLPHLPGERLGVETMRALGEPFPRLFIELLDQVGALEWVLPEIAALKSVPQAPEYHPEGDAWVHTMMAMDQAVALGGTPRARLATLLHDVGKGVTPPENWPKHIGHEETGLPLVAAICKRLKLSKDDLKVCLTVTAEHLRLHQLPQIQRPGAKLDLAERLVFPNRPDLTDDILLAIQADAQGRGNEARASYPQADTIREIMRVARAALQTPNAAGLTPSQDARARGMSGSEIGAYVRQRQIAAIAHL